MAKFIITRRKNSEFQFNLHAANNEIILSSEGYKQKAGCLNGIKSVVKNTSNDKMFERNISKNGKPYFNLKNDKSRAIPAMLIRSVFEKQAESLCMRLKQK